MKYINRPNAQDLSKVENNPPDPLPVDTRRNTTRHGNKSVGGRPKAKNVTSKQQLWV